MNWQYLIYFEVLAREEHFSKAAELLGITQSTLSSSIDCLEKDLGVPLFERNGHNIKLNKYGRVLCNHVIFATNEVEKGVKTIDEMFKMDSNVVSFASVFTMGTNFVPELIKSFRVQHPNVHLPYYQKSTMNILNDILDGSIQFGFCGEFLRDGPYRDIDSEMVLVEELLLAVPLDHPLAGRSSVSVREIVDEDFVGYTNNTGINHSLMEGLGKVGVLLSELKQNYQAAEDNTVVAMVRAGLGIAFVANNPTIYTEGVAMVPISEPAMSRRLYMVWNRNKYLSKPARDFKRHVLTSISPIA